MEGDYVPPSANATPKLPATASDEQPPTLAEPASGPVAAMSGGLQGSDAEEASKAQEQSTDEQPAEPTSTTEETEMNAESAPAADADVPAPNANGTPVVQAKKLTIPKRKSTGGVPEHKSRKLNKKKSMPKITHLDAQPGEFYFARLKSYPPWPSIVCDEEMLPQSLLTTRPVTTKQADGTYKEPYADNGKRAFERTFPVMFLHTNEFAWIPNTDLSPLDPADCKDFAEKGKAKSLIQAYNVAAEAHPLKYFKDMLHNHEKAMQEDEQRKAAREAAKAAKAERGEKPEKKKRKSEIAADEAEDIDMEDVEADGEEEPKKPSKKRKKNADSEPEEEKPAKTPKTATKLKLTTPKAPGTTEKKPKESAKASKPRAEKKRASKAAANDEEMEDAKEPEKPIDPAEEKRLREKEVLFLRHKLQKGFLSRDQAPQESEMAQMSNFIKKLEEHHDLEVSIIRTTKINKVLKALIKLDAIPKDEEFDFRGRSLKLLEKWNKLLGSENMAEGDGAGPSGTDKDEKPTTNGVHKEGKKEEKAAVGTRTTAVAPSEGEEPAADTVEKTDTADSPIEADETNKNVEIDGATT